MPPHASLRFAPTHGCLRQVLSAIAVASTTLASAGPTLIARADEPAAATDAPAVAAAAIATAAVSPAPAVPAAPAPAAVTPPPAGGPPAVTFEQHIRPIFKAFCFDCHGAEAEHKGQLDLRLRRLIVKGGESGPAIVPGDTAASLILEKLRAAKCPPRKRRCRPNRLPASKPGSRPCAAKPARRAC